VYGWHAQRANTFLPEIPMNRRLIPTLAVALLTAACSHKSTTSTPTPSATADRGPGGPDGRAGRGGGGGARDAMMLRGITLSTDQQQRVDSIRAAYRTQMQQMRQSGGDREAMRTQMRPMMEHQTADLRAVLTPEQQTVFDQNAAEMRSRMEQGGRAGGPPR
jgi:Spy/CpxP family protein refolding chaperone